MAAGNAIKVNCSFEGHEFVIFGIYGPSDSDNPRFFEAVFNESGITQEKYKILVGDFNVPLNFARDTNCINDTRKRAREKIHEKMLDQNLIDIFRTKKGNREFFTYSNREESKKSRLDYFLVSENLVQNVPKVGHGIYFRSDHRSIDLHIDFSNIKSGKKRWRFSPSMRADESLKAKITRELYESLFRYVERGGERRAPDRQEFFNTDATNICEYNYNIGWGEILNVTLNDVRNAIISYTAGNRQNDRQELDGIRTELLDIETNPTFDPDRKIYLNARYEELINTKAMKDLTNRQEAFKVDGERPTSFFLNLEKQRKSENYIAKLREGDRWITDQSEIDEKITEYYEDLYQNKDNLRTDISIESYIQPVGVGIAPKLDERKMLDLEGEIKKEEVWEVLKKTKDRSAPGLSGFTYTFFKDFWSFYGNILTKAFNESFTLGRIPDFMSRGVISLLPKGDKDKTFLKNWRPITLLECPYKLLSGVLASRLNSVINDLIDPAQKGFVPDRNIAENSRTFYDILDYAKREKKGGTAIVLDYEKAFDTLSHSYFEEVLKFFGFGENFINWIRICLKDFYACTSHADNISRSFPVGRGARQGDPLSPPIFALAIEIFSIKIRSSPEALPYSMGNQLIKLLLYADDSIIITLQDEDSVRFILKAVGEFFGLSGLKIQVQKCNIFNFGVPGIELCPDIEIGRSDRIIYLGNQFDRFLQFMDENVAIQIEEIIQAGKKWSYRFLTPLGRSTIAKSILIPKICHTLSVIKISPKVIKSFQSKIYEFIWGGAKKRAPFAREDAQVSAYEGGLDMPDIQSAMRGYQISWLRRACNNSEVNVWRDWLDELTEDATGLDFNQLMLSGDRKWQQARNRVRSTFWKEVFGSYSRMVDSMKKLDLSNILNMSIWNSSYFHSANSARGYLNPNSVRFNGIPDIIQTPLDLIGPEGVIMNAQERAHKFGRVVPDEILNSVSQAISTIKRADVPRYPLDSCEPKYIPFNYATLIRYKKGCSFWSRFLRRRKTENIVNFEIKMSNQLGIVLDAHRWKQIYWLVANIKYGNDIKWLVHQIIRGCLPTNYWLKKMKIRNCDLCTFCKGATENVDHLFWTCEKVREFLNSISGELDLVAPGFEVGFTQNNLYGKEVFILGDNRAESGLGVNYLYNIIKKFIWNIRCKRLDEDETLPEPTTTLNSRNFLQFLDHRLRADKILANKIPILRFISLLAARRGIG